MVIRLPDQEAPLVAAEPVPRARRSRRRGVMVVILVLVFLIAGIACWITVRGLLACQQLDGALPEAQRIHTAIVAHDVPAARSAAVAFEKRTSSAQSLTSDPIWRMAERVPGVGPNLIAVRTAAEATQQVAALVVQPLVRVVASADPRTFSIADGTIDLAPLIAAQPAVSRAQASFHAARKSVDAIDVSVTIHPVGSAVIRLRHFFAETAPAVDAVGNSAKLLPPMLGAGGPRTYLLVAQNPAELRATGGLIGSVAMIRADHGTLSLVAQQAGTAIGPWPQPVAEIPSGPSGLFGPLLARYLQDANLTPDFSRAAATVSRMWTLTEGSGIDGVVAMDPVVLASMLRATGPIALAGGDTVTAANAVPLLMSEVYRRHADPKDQDAFLAAVAAAVFQHVAQGGVDGSALVSSLAAAGSSHRLLIWSAHPDEQSVLATTTLAGGLPASSPASAGIGVYFNDATGAKMDYYLGTSVAAGAAICRADATPTIRVQVTLTSHAPVDAATMLPPFVTGDGTYGVPPGLIQTRVVVYGPPGGLIAATAGGPALSGTDRGRPVGVLTVMLAPGESATVSVDFLGVEQVGTGVTVATTPTLTGIGTTPDVGAESKVGSIAIDCTPS